MANQEPVLLLRIVLAFVRPVLDLELIEGRFVACHLGIERFLDAGAPLNLGLAFLDEIQDAVDVLELVAALPEHLGVLEDFFGRLALDLARDRVQVLPPVLLVGLDELVEVALGPPGEALVEQPLLLGPLLVSERLGLVDFPLLLSLLFLGLFGLEL